MERKEVKVTLKWRIKEFFDFWKKSLIAWLLIRLHVLSNLELILARGWIIQESPQDPSSSAAPCFSPFGWWQWFCSSTWVGWVGNVSLWKEDALTPLHKKGRVLVTSALPSILGTHSGLQNDLVGWAFTVDRCELNDEALGCVRQRGQIIVSDRTGILPVFKFLHDGGSFSRLTHLEVAFPPPLPRPRYQIQPQQNMGPQRCHKHRDPRMRKRRAL